MQQLVEEVIQSCLKVCSMRKEKKFGDSWKVAPECIVITIIGGSELHVHKVQGCTRSANKHKLNS